MTDLSKTMVQSLHVEENAQRISAVPDFVKVNGGLLLDAGNKSEHHLKVAKDGHVRNSLSTTLSTSLLLYHLFLESRAH